MLLPRFGPSRIEELTPITHGLADALIDGFVDTGHADVDQDYAQHIPVRVIARMLGVPLEDEDTFTRWAVTTVTSSGGQVRGRARSRCGGRPAPGSTHSSTSGCGTASSTPACGS